MNSGRSYQIWSVLCCLLMLVTAILLTIRAADGRLIYTLDDPYIHLAVAENILKGGYGINLAEYSSPSSSILWPLLLVPFVAAGLGDWGPLLLSGTASLLSMWILSGFVWRHLIESMPQTARQTRSWLFVVTPPLLALSINAIALPLTGMEHSLHVLGAMLVIVGLAQTGEQNKVPAGLIVGIMLCALIRFEGLALALVATGLLFWQRHIRVALVVLASVFTCLLAYALVMTHIGLPMLPSSVLVKSGVSAAAVDSDMWSVVRGLISNVFTSQNDRWGTLFAVTVLTLSAVLVAGRSNETLEQRTPRVLVSVAAILSLCAHLAFGRYGWFSRYEVYGVAIMILSVVLVFSPDIAKVRNTWLQAVLWPGLLAVLAAPYAIALIKTPGASRNVYEQQFQLHRFATEYFVHPVAVNDLGWTAYRNDTFVLDLWGLGSEEARKLTRAEGRTAAAVTRLTAGHGIVFAMIYDEWFVGAVPQSWCRVARLKTSLVTAASDTVAFYLVDRQKEAQMRVALNAFQTTLPGTVTFTQEVCNAI